jgi:hypothetical protein
MDDVMFAGGYTSKSGLTSKLLLTSCNKFSLAKTIKFLALSNEISSFLPFPKKNKLLQTYQSLFLDNHTENK